MLTLLPMPSIAPPITPPPISGRGAPSSWRRTARAEALRTRLRETAARLYARDGIDGVTIADIARAAQIPPGSATHAYPRRRDLLFDIVHAHIDALHEYVGRADDAFADDRQRAGRMRHDPRVGELIECRSAVFGGEFSRFSIKTDGGRVFFLHQGSFGQW